MSDTDSADSAVRQSYERAMKLWIGRHKEALEQIRAMESEILGLHRTLCAVVETVGGEVLVPKNKMEMAGRVLVAAPDAEGFGLHLSVREEE